MQAPRFWHQRPGVVAWALTPLGWLYGMITAWRMKRVGQRAGVPVICVGNLTAGGAGKTPTVLKLAALLEAQGRNPFILSRGYGGNAQGPLRVDPQVHDAATVGDEPLMMAAHAPVIIARDRLAGAALAVQSGADIIVMDDGLQNAALSKDFTLAVVDGGAGFGNGCVLPAGPLRAPLVAQWPHVDAVLVIGEGNAEALVDVGAARKPVLTGQLKLHSALLAPLAGKPLMAFAGIGRPEKFFSSLREAGLDVRVARAFGDHHTYTSAELARLRTQADVQGFVLVTTEKDAARLHSQILNGIVVMPVTLELDESECLGVLTKALKM
jgi:tetraacyldisaccharide 4'-kinase